MVDLGWVSTSTSSSSRNGHLICEPGCCLLGQGNLLNILKSFYVRVRFRKDRLLQANVTEAGDKLVPKRPVQKCVKITIHGLILELVGEFSDSLGRSVGTLSKEESRRRS